MENELLIHRIISGCVRLKLKNYPNIFLFKKPSAYQKYIGEELYHDLAYEYELQGLFSEEELINFMLDNGLWSVEEEERLEKLPNEIEEFKVGVYSAAFRSNEKATIKKALIIAKNERDRLIEKKFSYSHMSAQGAALLGKNRYLFGCALYYDDNFPVIKNDGFWKEDGKFIESLITIYNNYRISEEKYRLLARCDSWRTYWGCKKVIKNIFDTSIVDLTEEQKNLINWSILYDSVFECPDCPSDDIIKDDDALDGWLILQRRERDKSRGQKTADSILKDNKLDKADEVFLPVNTIEDAQKINDLNSDSIKAVKRQRDNIIKKKGEIAHDKLPDVKQELMMQANRQSFNKK